MRRRHLLIGSLAVAAAPAMAQAWPSKPVRIVVPFGPGGPADVYARIVGQELGEALKQQFVIENKPGAGGTIGADIVAKAAARRLHAADDVQHAHHQRDAARQQALRADARSHGGGAGQFVGPGDGGHAVGEGQDAAGAHCAGQGRARQARLRLGRPGHALSSLRRALQGDDRHRSSCTCRSRTAAMRATP